MALFQPKMPYNVNQELRWSWDFLEHGSNFSQMPTAPSTVTHIRLNRHWNWLGQMKALNYRATAVHSSHKKEIYWHVEDVVFRQNDLRVAVTKITECSGVRHVAEHAYVCTRCRRLHTTHVTYITVRHRYMLKFILWLQTFQMSVSTFFTTYYVKNSPKYPKNKMRDPVADTICVRHSL